MFQLPNHATEYATMSGHSSEAICPAVFIAAPTTATWLRPTSMHVAHAAPSVNIAAAVANAISTAAVTGSSDAVANINATPATTQDAAPTPHRPTRSPKRAATASVATPPKRSLGTLTSSGSPEKN